MTENIGTTEILAAIKGLGNKFDGLDKKVDGLDKKVDGLDKKFDLLDKKVDNLDQKIDQNFIDLHTSMSDFATHTDEQFVEIRATMVTKDHLDKKLGSLSGELVELTRKEDAKLITLVDVLHERKSITKEDMKKVVTIEPFAKLL